MCIFYPERETCRGCEESYFPELSDGGCKLQFEAGRTPPTVGQRGRARSQRGRGKRGRSLRIRRRRGQ